MVRLYSMLPAYANSPEAETIQDSYQTEIELLAEAAELSGGQLFVATASAALDEWEKMLGIPVDATLSNDIRRERIISKLRGAGTTTKAMVESVAESYYNGEVEIIEHNDEYYFDVKFLSTRGQPPGLDQLKAAIEEIKPAHLGVVYLFVYTTHKELMRYTHAQLAAYTHAQIRTL